MANDDQGAKKVAKAARRKARRLETLEASREKERIKARKASAKKAAAEGREVTLDLDRPKAPLLTEDEKRDRRRAKQKRWRAENLERAREIVRNSERRRAAATAIAEGREPGKKGPPKLYTEEEKRAKRKAKSEKWNAEHLEETREAARIREQLKRDGTFVSKALPRLTDEERRITNVAMGANRRARVRNAGGSYTKDDIIRLMAEQEGKCATCGLPFGDDGYHVDHFIPLSRGGSNDPSNLKLLHPTCNLKKGAKLPSEIGLVPDPVYEKGD